MSEFGSDFPPQILPLLLRGDDERVGDVATMHGDHNLVLVLHLLSNCPSQLLVLFLPRCQLTSPGFLVLVIPVDRIMSLSPHFWLWPDVGRQPAAETTAGGQAGG